MISDNWSNEVEQMSIVKARAMLTKLPEQLSESNQAVALTRRGTPVLAVMGWDLFESIVETLEIMGDPELMAILRRDINRVQEEGLVPVEQLLANINEEEALAGGE
jgi:PHD/YefM family antitoxin component YafN of YafNO toxin-antitoxin module